MSDRTRLSLLVAFIALALAVVGVEIVVAAPA
jgi:hypothetical protein